MKAYFHGEAVLSEAVFIGGEKMKARNGYYIIANSETTGNHHVVVEDEGVEMYEKDGVLYLKNDKEATVKCVIDGRHDAVTVKPGVWKIERAKEYDFLKDEVRSVAD